MTPTATLASNPFPEVVGPTFDGCGSVAIRHREQAAVDLSATASTLSDTSEVVIGFPRVDAGGYGSELVLSLATAEALLLAALDLVRVAKRPAFAEYVRREAGA